MADNHNGIKKLAAPILSITTLKDPPPAQKTNLPGNDPVLRTYLQLTKQRRFMDANEIAKTDASTHQTLHSLSREEVNRRFDVAPNTAGPFTAPEQTLLMPAAALGKDHFVQELADKGANLDAQDAHGLAAIHFAVGTGNAREGDLSAPPSPALATLVREGADLDLLSTCGRDTTKPARWPQTDEPRRGRTAIDVAVASELAHGAPPEVLLECGVENSGGVSGNVTQKIADARFLLKSGADVTADYELIESTLYSAMLTPPGPLKEGWKRLLEESLPKVTKDLGGWRDLDEVGREALRYAIEKPFSTGYGPFGPGTAFFESGTTEVLELVLANKVGLDLDDGILTRLRQLSELGAKGNASAWADLKAGLRALVRAGLPNDGVFSLRENGYSADYSPLFYAVSHRLPADVTGLLFEGKTQPQVDRRFGDTGMTSLMEAAAEGWAEGRRSALGNLELLLTKGANPNLADSEGSSALHHAAREGFAEAVRALLESPKLETRERTRKNHAGEDPMLLGAASSDEVLHELMAKGIRADDRVLEVSLRKGRSAAAVDELLGHGAKARASYTGALFEGGPETRYEPIHLLRADARWTLDKENPRTAMLDMLLKNGAAIDAVTGEGQTALGRTLGRILDGTTVGSSEAADAWDYGRLLLTRNADPNVAVSRSDATLVWRRAVDWTRGFIHDAAGQHQDRFTLTLARDFLVELEAKTNDAQGKGEIRRLREEIDARLKKTVY